MCLVRSLTEENMIRGLLLDSQPLRQRSLALSGITQYLDHMICNAIFIKCFTVFARLLAKIGVVMAQTMVNFRMDEDLKRNMEKACKDMGLTLTAAFTIFATKVARER